MPKIPGTAARYYVPSAASVSEFTEKRSRFIGHIWRVEREEEARARIGEIKAKYHDARHNCWCYILREEGAVRYSDDGEPQGTAGQPMLEIFRREAVVDVCCVVTRYFGGILLGTGGLARAYAKSAKDTLDAAGISAVRRWINVELCCPYPFLTRLKSEVEAAGGALDGLDYAAEVRVRALLPEECVEGFFKRIAELTAGGMIPKTTGEVYKAFPLQVNKE